MPDRKLGLGELIRAIRLNIAAEEEATALYEAHAEATDNPVARKVLLDVANEEREHVGEFVQLLNILTNNEEGEWMANGADEVNEMAAEVAIGDIEPKSPSEKELEEEGEEQSETGRGRGEETIGSLK